jgi:polyhydroxybutyrate depolymerase
LYGVFRRSGSESFVEKERVHIIYKNILAFTVLAAALAVSASRGDSEKTINVDGVEREYYVHIPREYDGFEPVPLVLALHGGGGEGDKMDRLTGFNDVADEEGFIVVYPQGINGRWNDGRYVPSLLPVEPPDDVSFLGELVKQLSVDYDIDENRVYATGISNGAFMSYRLAVEYPDVFAAVAGVAAQVSVSLKDKYPPERPIAVMMVLGDRDPLVPYEGGEINLFGIKRGEVLSAKESVAMWTENNGCSETPVTTYYEDIDGGDSSVARRDEYGSDTGADVVLITIEGGGHTWPGGWQYISEKIVGKTNRDINASLVIWEFLEEHSLITRNN